MFVEVRADVEDTEPIEFQVRKAVGLLSPRIKIELYIGSVVLELSVSGAEELCEVLNDAIDDARRLINEVAKKDAAAATAASRA